MGLRGGIHPSGNTNVEDQSDVQPSGQFVVTNTRLADLLRVVFDVQPHELVFGERLPSWVDSERWDIIGKARRSPMRSRREVRDVRLTRLLSHEPT
ncbi:MAG: hypothetical protein ACRD3G_26960 [Vicinamibacterales bacterium]